jgi:uncharacterized protein
MSYTVKVVEGKYKLAGEFHTIEPNQPIKDEKGKLVGICNPRRIVHHHSLGGEAAFFEGISKGKLIASRCENEKCSGYQSVYMPFRIHCPDCLERNREFDLTEVANTTARVYTFMVCERSGAFNTLEKPIRFINIEFEGVVTILMSYLVGTKQPPKMGMKVRPIFRTKNPTYTITDLAFVPAETSEKELPAGFTFSK